MRDMTNDQISDYKKDWIPNGYTVELDECMDVRGKDWCRHNLERWAWSMDAFTTAKSHTFLFEYSQNAEDFKSAVN